MTLSISPEPSLSMRDRLKVEKPTDCKLPVDRRSRFAGWCCIAMAMFFFAFALVALVYVVAYDLGHPSYAPLETRAVPYIEVFLLFWVGLGMLYVGKRTLSGKA